MFLSVNTRWTFGAPPKGMPGGGLKLIWAFWQRLAFYQVQNWKWSEGSELCMHELGDRVLLDRLVVFQLIFWLYSNESAGRISISWWHFNQSTSCMFSPHTKKNKKFSKPMECFMPEGWQIILFGKKCIVWSRKWKTIVWWERKTIAPPRVSNGPPLTIYHCIVIVTSKCCPV